MKKVTLPSNFKDYNFALLAKKEKNAPLKLRYLALSYIAAGKTVLESSDLVYKSSRMIHRWINRLAEAGIQGLDDRPGRGRKVHLAKDKEEEFKNLVLKFKTNNPKLKVTGRVIQNLLKNHYAIECTLPTAYNTLARLNLTNTATKQKPITNKVVVKPVKLISSITAKANTNRNCG